MTIIEAELTPKKESEEDKRESDAELKERLVQFLMEHSTRAFCRGDKRFCLALDKLIQFVQNEF